MKTEPVAISITLSDLVICEQGTGKNSLIGCFNNYNFLRFLDPEVKEFDVTARIEDPINGMVLASMGAHIQLREPFVLTKDTIIDVPMIGMPFIFQKPSNYLIIILVNNNQVGKRPLTVCAVTAPSNPPV
jgi:hypothetical protein